MALQATDLSVVVGGPSTKSAVTTTTTTTTEIISMCVVVVVVVVAAPMCGGEGATSMLGPSHVQDRVLRSALNSYDGVKLQT